ncbi:site-specific integrase [Sedimentibacter sp. zth1]|uniref:site-specific integrase n=1 Tax=Sedimentibacter sp. zth1 TaxID=2816908 RepID=UPI001A90D385|nr:site-specific integrase [Sedimentibacter sp. zth1]QSX04810.1 site-specific integrase [Sedimentibacter sp. zth1]
MNGHIYKRGSTYTYVIDLGRDPITNKRNQKSKGGFKTKKEANAALSHILASYNEGTYINETDMTLAEFSDKWIKLYSKTGNVKISTVRVRQHEINNVKAYFKEAKMKDITSLMYQDFLLYLLSNFAHNTLTGIHRTAKMIFKKAIEMRLILNDPTQYAKVPKKVKTVEELEHETEIPKYFEKEELNEFLELSKQDISPQTYVIFLTLAYTGIRIGELCALKWKDIDFTSKEISIYKTYYNPVNNTINYTLLPPKTKTSKRKIQVDDIVIEALRKHKLRQNELRLRITSWHKENFVFTKFINYPGYPETPKQIEIVMDRIIKKNGLKKLTPHGLRHTHVSLLAEAGVGLKEIMERLGHKDDETTTSIYMHVTKAMKTEASTKFSKLMNSV